MDNILLIKPPYMELSKPDYPIPNSLLKGAKYMNPALLIHGTKLVNEGYKVKILNLDKIAEIYSQSLLIRESVLAGISCTCAWEYLETLELCRILKEINPKIKIVVGGWQIKSIREKAFDDSKFIDFLCISNSELSLLNILKDLKGEESTFDDYTIRKNGKFGFSLNFVPKSEMILNFKLYPNYLNYLPYVEESRGCPNRCEFCLNSCQKDVYSCSSLEKFKKDVENIEKIYGENSNSILFASSFGLNSKGTIEKLKYLASKQLKWNLEMHIDSPWETYINYFNSAGIEKVSIGLESASPRILNIMNKSINVNEYLKRAEMLFVKLASMNIKITINVLFHYLDDFESIKETLLFLFKNKKYFYRVRFNHMYFFEGLSSNIKFEKILPYVHKNLINEKIHVFPLVPKEFSLQQLITIIDFLEKIFKQ